MAEPVKNRRAFPLVPAVVIYATLLAVAAGWSWLRGDQPLLALSASRPLASLLLGALIGTAAACLSAVMSRHLAWAAAMENTLIEMLGPLGGRQIAILALASSLAEESFFRGALQPALGLPAAALLFGLAHLAPRRELRPWVVVATAMGFVLGWLLLFCDSLLAPIACHLAVNSIGLVRLSAQARRWQ